MNQLADDLLNAFRKASVEYQDTWLSEKLNETNGLLNVVVDKVTELRPGVILTPYSSRTEPEFNSRILFEDQNSPIVIEHAFNRSFALTGSAVFAREYSKHAYMFRHYTDATVIKLTHLLYTKVSSMKGLVEIDATKVVEGLLTLITPSIKPDFRRSVYAIRIVSLMTDKKVTVTDRLWIRAHRDVMDYMKMYDNFKEIIDHGFYWRKSIVKGVISLRTCGLSAVGRQEIELRFRSTRELEEIPCEVTEKVIHPIQNLLLNEAVKFGMETVDMRRQIKRIIKSYTTSLSVRDIENTDALVSSLYPRRMLSFTINV